ncbi:hypothetical protein SteCoe_34075 [Stentor coeruleus]|uniref:Uncharacterized protein n=1 Tax=Stentor coeruleus TaxID=5963 RepID=A0A1R2AVC8_9CILI|nr:hypothetical protein SteCoe_34075 [Stentor coeruleus]
MGNCCTNKNLSLEADGKIEKPISLTKNPVTVFTFSGPQGPFERKKHDGNITFADSEFCPHNKSLLSLDISRENSMI